MRANYLIICLFTKTQRESNCWSEKRNRGEAFICLSVFSFVFCSLRALFEQTDDIIKEVLEFGGKPSILSRYAFCSLFLLFILGLSLSLFIYVSKERVMRVFYILLVSSVLDSLLFSLFFCRSFPLKSLVSKDRERKERELAATLRRRTAALKARTTLSVLSFP